MDDGVGAAEDLHEIGAHDVRLHPGGLGELRRRHPAGQPDDRVDGGVERKRPEDAGAHVAGGARDDDSHMPATRPGRGQTGAHSSRPPQQSRVVAFAVAPIGDKAGMQDQTKARLEQLLERGEEVGCVNLSELSTLVHELDLDDVEAEEVDDEVHARGLDVTDDCGRTDVAEQTSYANDDMAGVTSDALALFLRDIRQYPLLTKEEEVELASRVELGDLEAKERMINSNLRLVVSIAKKYQGDELPLDRSHPGGDLRADPRRSRSSTTAVASSSPPTRRSGSGRRSSAGWPTRPAPSAYRCTSASASERSLAPRASSRVELGREPTDEELAAKAEVTLEEIEEIREAPRTVTSLDRPVGEDEGSQLGDLLPSDERGPEEELEITLQGDTLRSAIARLPDRERKVIELRFGIDGDPPPCERQATGWACPQRACAGWRRRRSGVSRASASSRRFEAPPETRRASQFDRKEHERAEEPRGRPRPAGRARGRGRRRGGRRDRRPGPGRRPRSCRAPGRGGWRRRGRGLRAGRARS